MWAKKSDKPAVTEGLRPIVKDRFQKEVLQNCSSKVKGYLVLILDELSTPIISSCVGMYNLMESRVTLVENLTKQRAPYRQSAPIYFLSPTHDSIDRLIADWTPSKARKQPLYADTVFLYFTTVLSDELLMKIKRCKPLVKRLKALNELNVDFIANESRAFHLDMPSSFANIYNSDGQVATSIAEKLVTVCASLHEYPHIRYRASSQFCTALASVFNRKLTEYIGNNSNWWYHGDSQHTERGRSTFLLLSRADDSLSPLLHEFTYQAMVYDLLDVEKEKITYKSQTTGTSADNGSAAGTMDKDALLNDDDELWVELRGKHIADVVQILSQRIRDIVNSNTGVALSSNSNQKKALSVSQMANALRALPEYREVMSKLTQHMNMAHACMGIFNKQNLMALAEMEQTLATGKTEEGRVPRVSDLVEQVEDMLSSIPDSLTRFRLLATFVVSQRGLSAADQGRLMTAARLDSLHAKAMRNLELMGVPIGKADSSGNRLSFMRNKLVSIDSTDNDESEYASSRFACELKGILKDMEEKKLSIEEFPSILPLPEENSSATGMAVNRLSSSVRESGSRFSRRSATEKVKVSGSRQIVFIAGGACYSELRCARNSMESGGVETILGSTNFLNPKQFVDGLASL